MVLVLILAAHATLIYFMATRTHLLPSASTVEAFSSPVYVMPLVMPLIEKRDGRLQTKSKAPVDDRSLDSQGAGIAITFSKPVVSVVTQPTEDETRPVPQDFPASGVDWMHELAVAAREVATEKSAQQFGDRPQDSQVVEKTPKGLFDRGTSHHAGVIEQFEDGVERRWLSKKCYMDFGGPPTSLPVPGPRVNPIHCNVGSSSMDIDLLDHLKPKYLQPK